MHTKGPFKRTPFALTPWQEFGIIRPLFGEVRFSPEWGCYVRRYRRAYIILARKNGKSELAAGMLLYLLVGDDEEAAEVYGAAKDTKQAGKVFEPALRMTHLSPLLSKRLVHNKNARRIIDEKTASHYEIITADAKGELGHNPHGFNLDEVLSQVDGSLWEAMDTADGTRLQELLFATSTETNDPTSFGSVLIDEAERVQADPSRAPHVFAYVRKLPRTDDELAALRAAFAGDPDLPVSCDPFDEANWRWPNPALDDFLSRESLRRAAADAQQTPSKENGFRQFRMNQRVQQVSRWMSLTSWDASAGIVDETDLAGRTCFGGLDLASSADIAALCWDFPDSGAHVAVWRFWLPAERLPDLDRRTGGQASTWVRDGFLTVTEGDVIDYKAIVERIDRDARTFDVASVAYDRWGMTQLSQDLAEAGLTVVPFGQGFASMSAPTKEFERLVLSKAYRHGGNPVMRWMVDNIVIRTDPAGNVKIDKQRSSEKVDGPVAAVMALDLANRFEPAQTRRITVLR